MMQSTTIAIVILSVLDIALIILAPLLDRQMEKMNRTKNNGHP
jgi:uncharacterized membrane protein